MRYKFFTNSERSWKAMFEAIRSAKESVYLEMYIFLNDMVQYDFLQILKEKAREGLRVRIILDSIGSQGLSNDEVAKLRENGAEVIFLSYFLHRTHRKILVVDEERAFIGGVNLSQRFRFWNDLVLEIKDKRLVDQITRSFAKAYNEYGGTDSKIIFNSKRIVLRKTRAWLVEHFPSQKKYKLKRIYKEHIHAAKETIVLMTPYFMPKRWLIAALHQAVLRGVRVDILVPKAVDVFIADRVNYFYMYKLSKLGINFNLQPAMNHAKAMIIDKEEGMVGSNNLDFLSFEWNSEIGVFLKDEDVVKKLVEIAEKWKKEGTPFDFATYRPKLLDYVLSPILRVFTTIF